MEKFEATIMKAVVRGKFEPVLKEMKKNVWFRKAEEFLKSEETRKLKAECNDPSILLRISCLEEQVKFHYQTMKMVEDIIAIDWEKPEADLEYKSIKRCFYAMDQKRKETDFIFFGTTFKEEREI